MAGNVADKDILGILEQKNGILRSGKENILHQIARMLGHSNRGNDLTEQIRKRLLDMQSLGQLELEFDSAAKQRITLIRVPTLDSSDDSSATARELRAQLSALQQETVLLKAARQADAELVRSAQDLIAAAEHERDTAVVAAEAAKEALARDHRRAKDLRRIQSLVSQLGSLQTEYEGLQELHKTAQLASTRRIESLQNALDRAERTIRALHSQAEAMPCGCTVVRVVSPTCQLGGDHNYVTLVPELAQEGSLEELFSEIFENFRGQHD